MMKNLKMDLIFVAIAISLFVHLGAGLYVYLVRLVPIQSDAIDFTVVDKNDKKDEMDPALKANQIVDQDEKRLNDEKDKDAKYLSRFDQRVAHETRAERAGKFHNDAKMGVAPKNDAHHIEEQKKESKNSPKTKDKKQVTVADGDMPLPTIADLKPQFHWDKVANGVTDPGQFSQTDDHLKDLEKGPQTLLSTREFVYYSYYSRIKERLRVYWEPKIKEKVNRILASGRKIASEEERVTRLVITLDKAGKLVKVQVMEESGLRDLDDAAVEAFQSAAPFPNPPKGIVEPDGTIKIRWDFILEA